MEGRSMSLDRETEQILDERGVDLPKTLDNFISQVSMEAASSDYAWAYCYACRKVLFDSMEVLDVFNLLDVLRRLAEHKIANPSHRVDITLDATWEVVLAGTKNRKQS